MAKMMFNRFPALKVWMKAQYPNEHCKKEEVKKFTAKEILDVLTEIPGLNRMDIPKAVTKYRYGDPEQFKLLLELPIDERRDFVEYFLNEA
ncbi:hypothetical protein LINPERHAP1_LOCUS13125 [Linum perenne]